MSRKHRQHPQLNRVDIPPVVERGIILGADPVYCRNHEQLEQGVKLGRIKPEQFTAFESALQQQAFRRAHVGRKHSEELSHV